MGRWERATNSSGGARSGTVAWKGHARGTAMQGFRDSVGTGTGGTRSNRLECRTGTGLGPGQESGFQQLALFVLPLKANLVLRCNCQHRCHISIRHYATFRESRCLHVPDDMAPYHLVTIRCLGILSHIAKGLELKELVDF